MNREVRRVTKTTKTVYNVNGALFDHLDTALSYAKNYSMLSFLDSIAIQRPLKHYFKPVVIDYLDEIAEVMTYTLEDIPAEDVRIIYD